MKRSMLPLLALLLAAVAAMPGRAEERALYDARVFASVPAGDNGYVEGIAFDGTDVFAGTALGVTATGVPVTSAGVASRIFSWNRLTGDAHPPIVVAGEDTNSEHGIIGLKVDALGRLYALSSQLGVLRFTRSGDDAWEQETFAVLPDLQPCAVSAPPCSPTLTDRAPLGNDMTWDADGNLYVSDSFQATIWKVTPQGAVTPWFQWEELDRLFGANGLRVSPDGTSMLIAVTGPDSAAVDPVFDRGSRIVSVPFPDPYAGETADVFVFPNGELADGIAYGEHGDLYALSNAGNKLYILTSDGDVVVVTNDDLSGGGQMDFPASLVFDGSGALLITNYAYADGLTPVGNRLLLDVWVGDVGLGEPPA